MKLFLQLSSLQEADPIGSAYVVAECTEADLRRPFQEFAAIVLEPAITQLKQIHDEMKVHARS